MVTGPTTDGAGEPTQPMRVLDRPGAEERTRPVPDPSDDRTHASAAGWEVLSRPRPGARPTGTGTSTRQVLVQLVVGVLVILVLITLGGSWAARRLAEREAVNDAAGIADVLADTVVQPALTDALLDGDGAARDRFDRVVREQVLGRSVVRVRIWGADGAVLYADQSELVGRRFPLDPEEREVLRDPRTVAEISDLRRSENELDRVEADRLVEVYRPVDRDGPAGAVRDLHPLRPGQRPHRPAVARLRGTHADQPAALRGVADAAAVAPPRPVARGPAPA